MTETLVTTADLDPVTLEVIRHSLRAIAEELEANLTRTSFSPLIYEYKDFAVGIVGTDGELICQGLGGLPIFLADIGGPLTSVLRAHPLNTLAPGDAIITNDAAASGQHLNNVTMYTPVFDGTELISFIAVRTHWSDVGGLVLGSCLTNSSTDIFQEGIQLPALKICRNGVVDSDLLRLIATNCRLPDMVLGDLQAQLSACRLGEQRIADLLNKYGWHTIRSTIADTWERSERVARSRIANLPDGRYQADCWLDNDGINLDERIRFDVAVIIHGDEITVDMTNIADQVEGPYNSGRDGGGLTAAKVAYKYAVIPDLPADAGCFRPIHLILPQGKILSSDARAPKGRWNLPMASAIDVIIKAFAEVAPKSVSAGHHAAQNSFQFVGKRADGSAWQHHDTAHGGWGASMHGDGSGPYKTMSHGDCKDIPAEIVEALYPVRLESVRLRPDSAGPGCFRGGLGMVRQYTTLAPCDLTVAFERTTCPPWGLFGGKAAQVGSVTVEMPGEEPVTCTKATGLRLTPGTKVTIQTAGGGGYGNPAERDLELLQEDVRLGYVSEAAATAEYGLDTGDTIEVQGGRG